VFEILLKTGLNKHQANNLTGHTSPERTERQENARQTDEFRNVALKERVILYVSYSICKLDVVTPLMKQGGILCNQSQILHVTKQTNYIER